MIHFNRHKLQIELNATRYMDKNLYTSKNKIK